MTRLQKEIIKTVRELTRQIKIGTDTVDISLNIHISRVQGKRSNEIKSKIDYWTEEDLLSLKLANKSS